MKAKAKSSHPHTGIHPNRILSGDAPSKLLTAVTSLLCLGKISWAVNQAPESGFAVGELTE